VTCSSRTYFRQQRHCARSRVRGPHDPTVGDLLLRRADDDGTALKHGATLGGHVAVGLNTTRRGQALARDMRHSDCQVVLRDDAHHSLRTSDRSCGHDPSALPLTCRPLRPNQGTDGHTDPHWEQHVRGTSYHAVHG
jgi:hypothetical protein